MEHTLHPGMQYRLDPRTGNRLSALGYGCMRLPKKQRAVDQPQADSLIRAAIGAGMNYFDTAYIYAGSEEALGKALAGGWREKVYIATKLPVVLCRSAADIDRFFKKSLERLQTDHVDYYLMHMLQSVDDWQKLRAFGIEEWIAAKKREGSVRSIGFSFHGGREEFAKLLDAYDWDFCQIQYNYLDEHNQAGREGLEKAAAKGIAVIVMEPLMGGRLADNLPRAAADAFKKADPAVPPAEWGLRWVWNHPGVTVVLSGMGTPEQLAQNVKTAANALPGSLTPERLAVYGDAISAIRTAFRVRCTGCGYCMPCPAGVDIPSCFAAYNAASGIGKRVGFQQYMQTLGSLTAEQHYASLCKECGKCETHCPQSIPIRQELKNVSREMEPFWFKPGMAAARAFTGVRKKRMNSEQ